jgi:nucleotidyltransferase/DNA polymerase involved in DNA repair
MTVRQALGVCPEATIVAPDNVLYQREWESVLDALDRVSPEVEDAGLGGAFVNVRGLDAHYRDDGALASRIIDLVRSASGLEAAVGLAEGKFPAFAAATCAAQRLTTPDIRAYEHTGKNTMPACPPASMPVGGVGRGEERSLVVPVGGEGGFLAPLPIDLLPVDSDTVFRLRLFGFESIGEVAALSLPELQSQFGTLGPRLWRLANGVDEEPLRPRPPVEKVEAGVAFEAPVAGIEVMVAAAKQLLSRLRPSLRGRAARELVLQAELISQRGWERRIVLREAVSENERLDFVLRASLQNAPPPNAVRSISLRLSGLTGETGKQLSLGERGRLQRQLEECIRQLKARYGYSPVFRCVDVEPWSVIPEERQILVESDA